MALEPDLVGSCHSFGSPTEYQALYHSGADRMARFYRCVSSFGTGRDFGQNGRSQESRGPFCGRTTAFEAQSIIDISPW